MTNLPAPFSGIITPMVTPLKTDLTIDTAGLDRLIARLLDGGIHGLFILGTTGEAPDLSYSLRRELISLTCEFVAGRAPVMVGITDSSPVESLGLTVVAKDAGAAAVVAAPPFYFSLSQQELISYYFDLADKSPLPVFIYNMPSHTKTMIDAETVRSLSVHPNIVGIKDSSGNAPYFNSLLHLLKDDKSFSVFAGPDEMLVTSLLMGGNGGVNSGSNIFPRLFVSLFEAVQSQNTVKALACHEMIMEISTKIYSQGNSSYRYLQGIKQALSIQGICENIFASPLTICKEKESDIIYEAVNRITKNSLAIS